MTYAGGAVRVRCVPEITLDAVTLTPMGPAGAFVLTDEQVAVLGEGKKAFPVVVTVNGAAHQLRLARMGGLNLIGLSKAARAAAGVTLGEAYDIVVALDAQPRTVQIPAELSDALEAAGQLDRLRAMAPSHQKEYARWISEAKREQTRADRIAKAVTMIAEGQTR
jgi:Bacteriocin-protection, YdeI or OmpD-Associated/Domain of unknown function (DUF1905)